MKRNKQHQTRNKRTIPSMLRIQLSKLSKQYDRYHIYKVQNNIYTPSSLCFI